MPMIEAFEVFLRRVTMSSIIRYAAAAGIGFAMIANPSFAAKKQETPREAAIRKCNAQIIKQYPRRNDPSWADQRAVAWKDCMTSAGQRP